MYTDEAPRLGAWHRSSGSATYWMYNPRQGTWPTQLGSLHLWNGVNNRIGSRRLYLEMLSLVFNIMPRTYCSKCSTNLCCMWSWGLNENSILRPRAWHSGNVPSMIIALLVTGLHTLTHTCKHMHTGMWVPCRQELYLTQSMGSLKSCLLVYEHTHACKQIIANSW